MLINAQNTASEFDTTLLAGKEPSEAAKIVFDYTVITIDTDIKGGILFAYRNEKTKFNFRA